MENGLNKKYGLLTAISMVVGIVIGSGVFFKAEAVLKATGGNIPIGIAAWGIVGLVMIVCAYSFATMAAKYEKVNGIVDYAEAAVGPRYGYCVGWFMATIYQPTITAVLAWVSARYTCVLLGWDITGGACMAIAGFFLIASFALNTLSPVLAGKFQVTATVIKMIPLLLMAVAGTVMGLSSGLTIENFARASDPAIGTGSGLFASVVAVAFAYEGWIIATSINSEIRDSKKNLPRALILGSVIVAAIYILYYIGLAGVVPTEILMENGQTGAMRAFQKIFGSVGGSLIFVFVIISCLGTLNGLMLGCTRGLYALANRNAGPCPEIFRQVDPATNMPTNSSVIGLLLCSLWLLYFYGATLASPVWFGPFCFDISELPIITLYASYIPIFLMLIRREKSLGFFKRFFMPILAVLGCIFMVTAACFAHRIAAVFYLLVFAAIMLIGWIFRGDIRRSAFEEPLDVK